MTNAGDYDYDGYYAEETIGSNWYRTDTEINLYAYSNAAYAAAQTIKEKATLYTVGLFQTMEDMPEQGEDIVQFFKIFTQDMATSENHFYDIKNPDDLRFVFGDIAEDITKPKEISFKFAWQIEQSKDTESFCYYTDAYFYKPAGDYNSSLATMSLCLELSAWTSHDVSVDNWNPIIATQNVEKLLTGKINNVIVTDEHLGFSDFQRSDDIENGKPTADSIGAVIAQKQINDGMQDYTLIALAVRGGGYGSEWAGNLTIGSENEYSNNHKGFELARDGVLEFLTDYIDDNNITGNIKLWIVGFSRGAITANMAAGSITEFGHVLPVYVAPENIYCYTFETPQGVVSDNFLGYSNIHNIININDLVPLVAPSVWGFARYGVDIQLPNAYTSQKASDAGAAMISELVELVGGGFILYPGYKIAEKYKIITDIEFDWWNILPGGDSVVNVKTGIYPTKDLLNHTVDWLFDDVIESREIYATTVENSVRKIVSVLMDNYSAHPNINIRDCFFDSLNSTILSTDGVIYIIEPLLRPGTILAKKEMSSRLEEKKHEFLDVFFSSVNIDIDANEFSVAMDVVFDMLFETLAEEVWNHDFQHIGMVGAAIFYLLSSNFQAHYPEVCLAWMRSLDPYYNENFSNYLDSFNSSTTRVIHINCPVNVNVYDDKGILVASIVNDVVVDGLSSIVCLINGNGEKIVYLPGDGDYAIDIVATDDGFVSYSINEYNFIYGTETRIQNYYDIPITVGDVLKAVVPQISDEDLKSNNPEGSSTVYQLEDKDSNILPPSSAYTGKQVQDVQYTITLSEEGNGGYVTGAGAFSEGHFAQVQANIYPTGEFLGWYEDDVLISANATYRFAVRKDIELTAKFKDVVLHEFEVNSTTGGQVASVGGYYSEGVQVSVVAEAQDGYVFDYWSTSDGGIFEDSKMAATTFIIPNNSTVITAHFKSTNPDYQIVFNPNGGVVNPDCMNVNVDGKLSDLPTPTKSGYIFDGWYDDITVGNQITTATIFTNDTEIFAHWSLCNHNESTAGSDCEHSAICTICGGTIAELGHDFENSSVWITTNSNGHYKKCTRCDVTDEANKVPHDYTNACDITCNTCGYERSIVHNYTVLKNSDTEHWYVCSVCGDEHSGSREPHEGGNATCIAKAVCVHCKAPYGEFTAHQGGIANCTEKATCIFCGEDYGETAPTNHDFNTAWLTDEKSHWHKCSRCDEVDGKVAHEYNDNNLCVCGEEKSQTIDIVIIAIASVAVLCGGFALWRIVFKKKRELSK